MEPDCLLPCSQKPTTEHYSEPDELRLHPHVQCFQYFCQYIYQPLMFTYVSKVLSSLQDVQPILFLSIVYIAAHLIFELRNKPVERVGT
jgi:hypothetical protein